jgi:DNA-binding HxlR family transcriptional regulator
MKKNHPNKVLKKVFILLNNRYKLEIIYYLSLKKLRFGEIKICLETITQQLLTKLLREMEKDKLITRVKFEGFPRRVDYSLSKFGETTKPIVSSLLKWEKNNEKIINKLMKKKILDSIYDYY